MKSLILFTSILLIFLSLFLFLRNFIRAKSGKEKIAMSIAFFSEPLDLWSSVFYLGLLGLISALLIL